MTDIVDLRPAASRMSDLVKGIGDDQLSLPTPCGDRSVGDLLDHVGGLAQAFTAAANKELDDLTAAPPAPDAGRLSPAWRDEIPDDLAGCAQAWTSPSAWEGMTQVGGVTLPGELCGLIALNETVLHAWDLARATGQPYEQDHRSLEASMRSLLVLYPPNDLQRRKGIFEAPVDVAPDAPLVDRLVAFSGRNPGWRSVD